ncbi:MAG: 7-cyano-7-deazaguanine synthase [Planctomycetota bacterium]
MADRRHVMILHGGGLRSLVATALVLNQADAARVTLLHIDDGRDAAAQRAEYVRRQADHYALRRLDELSRPHLYGATTAQQPDGLPRATLAEAQLMLTAMAHAIDAGADELLWPIAVDGDTAATAAAQERQIVCTQLAEAEFMDDPSKTLPEVTLPLLGYRDAAVVELGSGLGVPWELAWSCAVNGETQCGGCPACRRRRAAFRAAGVVDPVFAPVGVR